MTFNRRNTKRWKFKFSAAAVGAIIYLALYFPSPANAQALLEAGSSHTVTPSQTNCLTAEVIVPDNAVVPVATAECDTATGIADVRAGTGRLNPRAVGATATSVFQYLFEVEATPGSAAASYVPINVALTADWAGLLKNTRLIEFAGSSSLNIYLQLRQDAVAGGSQGTIIIRETILGASHEGIGGCLSIPSDIQSVTSLAIGCFLARFQTFAAENSFVALDAVVEVGRTYGLELVISAQANARFTLDPNDNTVASTPKFVPINEIPIAEVTDQPGLQWSSMVVTVATDPNAIIAGLQVQIDQLREDLENHTHNYQTGRGVGHNNTQAISSPAIIPGDSATGFTAEHLQSGPVTGR